MVYKLNLIKPGSKEAKRAKERRAKYLETADEFFGEGPEAPPGYSYTKPILNKKPKKSKIEKDIKKLTKDISKTKIPKSTFKPEIDSMKEKLNNISKKLFNKKKITSLIEDVKKTNTPKSTYKPNIQSLKDTLNVIGRQLKYKKLRALPKSSMTKKTDYEQEIKELSPEGKKYVDEVKYILENSKVSGGKQTKDLDKAKIAFSRKNKPSDVKEAATVIRAYRKTLPKHVPEPGKGRGKGKKTIIRTPEEIAYDKRHKVVMDYIKNKIADDEFEATDEETIEFMADEAMEKGIKRMSILIIEQLKHQ